MFKLGSGSLHLEGSFCLQVSFDDFEGRWNLYFNSVIMFSVIYWIQSSKLRMMLESIKVLFEVGFQNAFRAPRFQVEGSDLMQIIIFQQRFDRGFQQVSR